MVCCPSCCPFSMICHSQCCDSTGSNKLKFEGENVGETVGLSMQVKGNLLHLRPISQYFMRLKKLSVAQIGLEELQVNIGGGGMLLLSSLIENGFLESCNLLKFGPKMSRSFNVHYLFPRLVQNDYLLNYPMSQHLIEVSEERGRSLFACNTESLNIVVLRQCKKLIFEVFHEGRH
jgi:hypothetical protein